MNLKTLTTTIDSSSRCALACQLQAWHWKRFGGSYSLLPYWDREIMVQVSFRFESSVIENLSAWFVLPSIFLFSPIFGWFSSVFRFARFTWSFWNLFVGSAGSNSHGSLAQVSFWFMEIWGSNLRFMFRIWFCFFPFLPSVLEQISCHAARGARPAERDQLRR